MRNLHSITTYGLSEEDKQVVVGFYENAYVPGGDRRIKFSQGKVYYFPNGKQAPLNEWEQIDWRLLWLTDYKGKQPFDLKMVVIE